jgi:hypothetical protein
LAIRSVLDTATCPSPSSTRGSHGRSEQFTFAGAFDFPAIPEHRAASLEWVTKELPALLVGWVEGKGSPLYKGQSLRVLNGGLEQVYEGLDILRRGAYKAEKLVYKLA